VPVCLYHIHKNMQKYDSLLLMPIWIITVGAKSTCTQISLHLVELLAKSKLQHIYGPQSAYSTWYKAIKTNTYRSFVHVWVPLPCQLSIGLGNICLKTHTVKHNKGKIKSHPSQNANLCFCSPETCNNQTSGFPLYFGIEIQGLFKDFQGP